MSEIGTTESQENANNLLIENIKANEGKLPKSEISIRVGFDNCNLSNQTENSRLAITSLVLQDIKRGLSEKGKATLLYGDIVPSHQDVIPEDQNWNESQVNRFAEKCTLSVASFLITDEGGIAVCGGEVPDIIRYAIKKDSGEVNWESLSSSKGIICKPNDQETLVSLSIPNVNHTSQTNEIT
jgi:hypothetical protein